MKKIFTLLAALMVFAACQKEEGCEPVVKRALPRSEYLSYAEAVDIATEAASMLESPNQSRSAIERRVKLDGVTCRVKNATRSGESADSLYYVVNYEDEAGFALVAARRDAPVQLLAVIEAGNYSAGETTENEGFNMYVKAMENSIENTRSGHILKDSIFIKNSWYETEEVYSSWDVVYPLVNVRWGQGYVRDWNNTYDPQYPYNKYCISKTDSVSYAGCVITALAQIMSQHKQPSWYILNYVGQNQLKTIDWDVMSACIGGPYYNWDVTDADEIALWFRQIGDIADAEYTPDGTSASGEDARRVLYAYNYSYSTLKHYDYDIVRKELQAGRSVYIQGFGETLNTKGEVERNGHAWVVDGYKSRTGTFRTYEVFPLLVVIEPGETTVRRELVREETYEFCYLHNNWGYDGFCNGYFTEGVFRLNSEKEEAGGYDYDDVSNNSNLAFSLDVKIIKGIKPNN